MSLHNTITSNCTCLDCDSQSCFKKRSMAGEGCSCNQCRYPSSCFYFPDTQAAELAVCKNSYNKPTTLPTGLTSSYPSKQYTSNITRTATRQISNEEVIPKVARYTHNEDTDEDEDPTEEMSYCIAQGGCKSEVLNRIINLNFIKDNHTTKTYPKKQNDIKLNTGKSKQVSLCEDIRQLIDEMKNETEHKTKNSENCVRDDVSLFTMEFTDAKRELRSPKVSKENKPEQLKSNFADHQNKSSIVALAALNKYNKDTKQNEPNKLNTNYIHNTIQTALTASRQVIEDNAHENINFINRNKTSKGTDSCKYSTPVVSAHCRGVSSSKSDTKKITDQIKEKLDSYDSNKLNKVKSKFGASKLMRGNAEVTKERIQKEIIYENDSDINARSKCVSCRFKDEDLPVVNVQQATVNHNNSRSLDRTPVSQLSAQVMNLSSLDIGQSLQASNCSLQNFKYESILEKIKNVYKACTCKVCECVAAITSASLQPAEDICECKPCECIECQRFGHQNLKRRLLAEFVNSMGRMKKQSSNVDNNQCKLESNPYSTLVSNYEFEEELCSNVDNKEKPRAKALRSNTDNKTYSDGKLYSIPMKPKTITNICDCKPCECVDCLKYKILRNPTCDCKPCECIECQRLDHQNLKRRLLAEFVNSMGRMKKQSSNVDNNQCKLESNPYSTLVSNYEFEEELCSNVDNKEKPRAKALRSNADNKTYSDGKLYSIPMKPKTITNICDCKPCECVDCLKYKILRNPTCDCKPCECFECRKVGINNMRTIIVAPVGEDNAAHQYCRCSPCGCAECVYGHGRLPGSMTQETGTSAYHDQSGCNCESCNRPNCLEDGSDRCTCERYAQFMRKPVRHDSNDYDIHSVLVNTTDSAAKRRKPSKTDTIAMFASCSYNPNIVHLRNSQENFNENVLFDSQIQMKGNVSNMRPESYIQDDFKFSGSENDMNGICKSNKTHDCLFDIDVNTNRSELCKSKDTSTCKKYKNQKNEYVNMQDLTPELFLERLLIEKSNSKTRIPNNFRCVPQKLTNIKINELHQSVCTEEVSQKKNYRDSKSAAVENLAFLLNDNVSGSYSESIKCTKDVATNISDIYDSVKTAQEQPDTCENKRLVTRSKCGENKSRGSCNSSGYDNSDFIIRFPRSTIQTCMNEGRNNNDCLNENWTQKIPEKLQKTDDDVRQNVKLNKVVHVEDYGKDVHCKQCLHIIPRCTRCQCQCTSCFCSGTCLNEDPSVYIRKNEETQTLIKLEERGVSAYFNNHTVNFGPSSQINMLQYNQNRRPYKKEVVQYEVLNVPMVPENTQQRELLMNTYSITRICHDSVQETIKGAKAFSMELLALLHKYEKANKEFESVTMKLKYPHNTVFNNDNVLKLYNDFSSNRKTSINSEKRKLLHYMEHPKDENYKRFNSNDCVLVQNESKTEAKEKAYCDSKVETLTSNKFGVESITSENHVTLKDKTAENIPFLSVEEDDCKIDIRTFATCNISNSPNKIQTNLKDDSRSIEEKDSEACKSKVDDILRQKLEDGFDDTMKRRHIACDSDSNRTYYDTASNSYCAEEQTETSNTTTSSLKLHEASNESQILTFIKEPTNYGNKALLQLQKEIEDILRSPFLSRSANVSENIGCDKERMPELKCEMDVHEKPTKKPSMNSIQNIEEEVSCVPEASESEMRQIAEFGSPSVSVASMKERHQKVIEEIKANPLKDAKFTSQLLIGESNAHFNASTSKSQQDPQTVTFQKVNRISDHTILVKWKVPECTEGVMGYELLANGRAIEKILNPTRNIAVVTSIPTTEKVLLTIRSITSKLRAGDQYPSATTVYRPRAKCDYKSMG